MPKEIWVFAEVYNNSIERVSLELLGEARKMSKHLLIRGSFFTNRSP